MSDYLPLEVVYDDGGNTLFTYGGFLYASAGVEAVFFIW